MAQVSAEVSVAELESRVSATAAREAAAGAVVQRARQRLAEVRTASGGRAVLEELHAQHDAMAAETAYQATRADHSAARDALFDYRRRDFENSDRPDVFELATLLQKAASVERRRVTRVLQFEERTGRQLPGDYGNWPELFSADKGDLSRLDRFLQWARERRGFAG